jgi:hypothetical protein
MAEQTDSKFSLVIGGPFYRMQDRLGLLGPDLLPPIRTAIIFVALAWLPLALLSAAQGMAWNASLGKHSFLLDYTVHARFIISIFMFVMMERSAEKRIAMLIRQFFDSGLVRAEDRPRFQQALRRADEHSGSTLAELAILALAYAISVKGVLVYIAVLHESWPIHLVDGRMHLSPAGWWTLLISQPLFWFLLLRWLWRFVVWTMLLRDISRFDLRLVATHPDQSGGVGFLGLFPPTFTALVFALSCVTASLALEEIMFAGATLQSMAAFFGGWLVLVVLIFVGPLLVFAAPLARLQRSALLQYGSLASYHNRTFEKRWLLGEKTGEDTLGSADISSLSDMGTCFQQVRSMRPIPAGKETFLPLVIATCLPWLAVVLTQIPFVDILKAVAQSLL